MLLTSLKIEHYRGIKLLDLALGPTTVLVGENNCGKTTVLHSLRAWQKAPSRFLIETGLLEAKE